MKLGDVLRIKREHREMSTTQVAIALGLSAGEYEAIESGNSPAEEWAPILAGIAVELETPTKHLISESGRAEDARPGQVGPLVRGHRERLDKTPDGMAATLEIPPEAYLEIEAGDSDLEVYGPLFVRFAEVIDDKVFNLFYPLGLPFQELEPEDLYGIG